MSLRVLVFYPSACVGGGVSSTAADWYRRRLQNAYHGKWHGFRNCFFASKYICFLKLLFFLGLLKINWSFLWENLQKAPLLQETGLLSGENLCCTVHYWFLLTFSHNYLTSRWSPQLQCEYCPSLTSQALCQLWGHVQHGAACAVASSRPSRPDETDLSLCCDC